MGPTDRLSHMHLLGKTGVGKSSLLRTLLLQDLSNGTGCLLLDPHGDLAEDARATVGCVGRDAFYLDLADPSTSVRLNPFAGVPAARRPLAAAGLVEVFKKLWADEWGPRLEHLLRNVVFTLLERKGSTLGDIPPLLTDKDFRRLAVAAVSDPLVRSFWEDEFNRYSPGFRSVVTAPLLNKVGAFLSDPHLRRVLCDGDNTLRFRRAMDSGAAVLVNLSKGRMGEGPSALLGSLLVSQLALAGLSRANQPGAERRPFFVYLDEFQTFGTRFLTTMLSELRKYGVGFILANQYLSQLDPEVRDAVIGNVGTLISFRVGGKDAAALEREFAPVFSAEDLVNLPNYHIYLRLMIRGQVSKPFSAETLHPDEVDRLVGLQPPRRHATGLT